MLRIGFSYQRQEDAVSPPDVRIEVVGGAVAGAIDGAEEAAGVLDADAVVVAFLTGADFDDGAGFVAVVIGVAEVGEAVTVGVDVAGVGIVRTQADAVIAAGGVAKLGFDFGGRVIAVVIGIAEVGEAVAVGVDVARLAALLAYADAVIAPRLAPLPSNSVRTPSPSSSGSR